MQLSRLTFLSFLLIASVSLAWPADPGFEETKEAMFEQVWGRVNESHFDPEFGGKDWVAIGSRYRSRLERVDNEAALEALLNEMLAELESSHFGIMPARAAKLSATEGWQGGDAGLELTLVDAKVVVHRVERGGPAWRAGLRDGDEVERIGGIGVAGLWDSVRSSGLPEYLWKITYLTQLKERLAAQPGESVELSVVSPKGRKKERAIELVEYTGRLSPRFGQLGELPLTVEAKQLKGGIAYLRFSMWVPAAMAEVRTYLEQLDEEVNGLIIDLRGNPGGIGLMAGGVAGLLVDEQTELATTHLREGHINFIAFPQSGAYLGPLAVLVDEGSCSTSEIFALGLQEAGRARVFGQPTPGAALTSTFTELPNGAILQSVMGDLVTPAGTRLEGRGVIPDEIVALSPVALRRGRDTVIDAAKQWIQTQTKEPL